MAILVCFIFDPTDTAHLLIFKGEGYIRLSEHWVHQQESGFYSRISSNAEFVKNILYVKPQKS